MKDLLIPLRILHGRFYEWRSNRLPWIIKRIKNPGAVFLVLTPTHGNLGDHAIAKAECEMLSSLKIKYIEVSIDEINNLIRTKTLNVFNGRPILVHGGGNLGTLWFKVEEMTREVIINNPRSQIILLPNTIFYENTDWGNKEKTEAKEIYNNHKHLKAYAREKSSFNEMLSMFRHVEIAPDMVFRLDESYIEHKRKGCLLCLRKDKEKTRSYEFDVAIINMVTNTFGECVLEQDMVVGHKIPIEKREEELSCQFSLFRAAELVITDRLHGMIFAAITGTPCIVIDSRSPKVRGCYEWISKFDYIRFCDTPESLIETYEKLPKEARLYHKDILLPLYGPLIKDIQSVTKGKRINA